MTDLRNYAIVTVAYWGFTLTDGALRMLVLLHFHGLGFTPLDLAILFLLYEAMGILTNLLGGWLGAKFGLRLTLIAGLSLQIVALFAMSAVQPDWLLSMSLIYVMAAQALSGIAKDLTKMSSKSAVKLVIDDQVQGQLFRWVALLTGSKNALKGIGFLLGGVMLGHLGFQGSMWLMASALASVLILFSISFRGTLGKAKALRRRDLFAKQREINLLSAARLFLFAARDIWFVVGVPIFLYSELGWSFTEVGGFLAIWVIGYGAIQACAPTLLRKANSVRAAARSAAIWGTLLISIPIIIAFLLQNPGATPLTTGQIVIVGIYLFGAVFALNSSIHSYLIVAFADRNQVSMDVGFYYMANAAGRFMGTFLSGLVFQLFGLCFFLFLEFLNNTNLLQFFLSP